MCEWSMGSQIPQSDPTLEDMQVHHHISELMEGPEGCQMLVDIAEVGRN